MKRPSSFSNVALSDAGSQIIGPNPRRYALLISAPYSDATTQSSFAPRSISAIGDGFTLQPGSDPLYLSLDSHGWIVQESWWGVCSATRADNVSIIEVSLNPNESRD